MTRNDLPWPELYRPASLSDIVGNKESILGLKKWILQWKTRIPKKRGALLVGPPGVGKTATVMALTNDLDIELVEFNASDKRNKGAIETQVWRAATQQTIDARVRVILLDEVDGLSGTSDRGGIGAILKILSETVHPIIMTANNPEHPRLKDLLKVSRIFPFSPLESDDALIILKKILADQSTTLSDNDLFEIIDNSAGDLRAAIADLETRVKGGVSESFTLASRDVKVGIKRALRRLAMTTDAKTARRIVDESDLNYDELLLWLDQNIHLHLTHQEELNSGYEALSLADLVLGRIFKDQNWKLLSYAYDFLSAGVATSRTKSPFRDVEYSESTWPLLMWKGSRKRDKRKGLLGKLAMETGVSKMRVQRTHLDTIDRIIERSPKLRNDFADWLGVKKTVFDRKGS
jgi:replication factor C large subunit